MVGNIIQIVLGLILLLYAMAIFETEYSFQFVSANPPFLSSPTNTRFKQLLSDGSYSKNPNNL